MDAVLQNSPRRASLLTSTVCGTAAISANFTGTPTTINVNGSVTFTDGSTSPDNLLTWNWTFNGGTPASHSGQTPPAITYTTAGQYDVTLTVTDDNAGSDTETKSMYITVNPAGTSTCDSTLANWDFDTHAATTGTYTWGAGNGYMLGQNTYGDNGWADKIVYSATGTELTDVLFYFGVNSGTGNINFKVWGDASGSPDNGNVMTTQSVAISSLSVGGTPTLWSLATPTALNGNFYIGFDHNTIPAAGDTAAIMSAVTSTNSLFSKETGGWTDLSTYNVTQGMALIPVICNTSTGEKELIGKITQVSVFPNPSIGTFNIALTSKVNTTVSVFNTLGEEIYNYSKNTQLFTIDMNNQPNGVYFIKVTSNGEVTTKKILLSK
jgi:PKD repeat protein